MTTSQPEWLEPDLLTDEELLALSARERRRYLALLKEVDRRKSRSLFHYLFPDEDHRWTGPSLLGGLIQPGQVLHAREKYAKHLEFFRAGLEYRERCFMAANRIGKSFSAGAYEVACHLTGLYPEWWEGRRFPEPISAWVAGDTITTTRDILQLNLLGNVASDGPRKSVDGTGVIPGDMIKRVAWKPSVTDAVDSVAIRHVTGGMSGLQFKSYEQGRKIFQGTSKHVIWLDEECPEDVYDECLIRTTTVKGLVILTFTPLQGLTPLTLSFLPAEMRPAA